MALYVNAENQTLLWNVVHTHNFAIQFFSRITPAQKTEWFKSIIKRFYDQNANRNLSPQDLQQLNKTTLSYMLYTMKSPIVQETIQTYTEDPPKNAKEIAFSQQFDMKKKEYESLFEKKAPETVDFREKVEDGAITNMDDLIQNHIREREEELRKYSQQTNLVPQSLNTQPSNVQSLKIDSNATVSTEILNAQVLDNEEKRQKKNVTWKVDDPEQTSMLLEDFEVFKQHTREQLKLLQDQIHELQKITTVIL
jgi:hypothetical protein